MFQVNHPHANKYYKVGINTTCIISNIFTLTRRTTPASSIPYWSAHEGVFVSRFHIKEYLSWFNASLEPGAQQSSATPATNASKFNLSALILYVSGKHKKGSLISLIEGSKLLQISSILAQRLIII